MAEKKKGLLRAVAETGLSLAAGAGIAVMMKTVVNILTPEDAKKITKFCCKFGGLALAGALSRVADDEIKTTFDEVDQAMHCISFDISKLEPNTENTNEEEPENEDCAD